MQASSAERPSTSRTVITVGDAPSEGLRRAGGALALNGESGRLAAWYCQRQHFSVGKLGARNAGNQVTVVKATIEALKQLRTQQDVERLRGVALA